jgi:hypothetical protein
MNPRKILKPFTNRSFASVLAGLSISPAAMAHSEVSSQSGGLMVWAHELAHAIGALPPATAWVLGVVVAGALLARFNRYRTGSRK